MIGTCTSAQTGSNADPRRKNEVRPKRTTTQRAILAPCRSDGRAEYVLALAWDANRERLRLRQHRPSTKAVNDDCSPSCMDSSQRRNRVAENVGLPPLRQPPLLNHNERNEMALVRALSHVELALPHPHLQRHGLWHHEGHLHHPTRDTDRADADRTTPGSLENDTSLRKMWRVARMQVRRSVRIWQDDLRSLGALQSRSACHPTRG